MKLIQIILSIMMMLIAVTIAASSGGGYSGRRTSRSYIPSIDSESGSIISGGEPPIPIIKMESKTHPDGSYAYEYETANGIEVRESGFVKNSGLKGHEIQVAEGSFSYTSPEGEPIHLTYVADENGFQAQGSHLPTPPPIPLEIQEALNKISESGGGGGEEEEYGHEDGESSY